MTENGTSVIKVAERVVVSQLIRSPGVYFKEEKDPTSGRSLHSAKLIPSRGAWLEFETNKRDVIPSKLIASAKFRSRSSCAPFLDGGRILTAVASGRQITNSTSAGVMRRY
jgi:DNA-directed RNA polymerase subunit beta (EC 2.7.7.6)